MNGMEGLRTGLFFERVMPEGVAMMTKESLEFVVYLIHACARKWHMTPEKVYQLLESVGCVSKFLIPLYDILHTQSVDFVVEDIEEYLVNRGIAF